MAKAMWKVIRLTIELIKARVIMQFRKKSPSRPSGDFVMELDDDLEVRIGGK